MSKYEALAAKRFRGYRWQKRKERLNRDLLSLTLASFSYVMYTLERIGLAQKHDVETVKVE